MKQTTRGWKKNMPMTMLAVDMPWTFGGMGYGQPGASLTGILFGAPLELRM